MVERRINDPRIEEGRKIAQSYAGWAASAGLTPIPLLDIGGLMTTQLAMLHELSVLFDVPFERKLARSVLLAAVGGALPQSVIVLGGASLLKAIPFVGGLLGAAAMPGLAIASTMALAEFVIHHFATGGTLEDARRGGIAKPIGPITDETSRAAEPASPEPAGPGVPVARNRRRPARRSAPVAATDMGGSGEDAIVGEPGPAGVGSR